MDEQHKRVVSPITLFYSYAHEDELLRNELEKHLSLLQRQGLISEWHDRQILPGDEWAHDIDTHLETASIILLLISPGFLASDYCYDIEMQGALERHKRRQARVIPIILRPCDWHSAPFGSLQCLPRDGKAVTTWQNLDEAFLAIAEELRQVIERQRIPTRPLPEVERKNRIRLLKRVRATWIEGVLEQSRHQAALITLNLQDRPDALDNPWHLEVQETNQPPRHLPPGTSIVQVYDEADGELLILGEPGSGKTTLLLELAEALLDRAERDMHACLPVIFNLTSWAQKRLPLTEWFIDELDAKYEVSPKIGTTILATYQLLPLLDGLDEVAPEARVACIEAIKSYHRQCLEKGSAPLVVCCRSKDYEDLPSQVNVQRAVSLLPLSKEEVEAYLQGQSDQLDALRQALQDDAELAEMVRLPLMLNIFTLAYQGATSVDLPSKATKDQLLRTAFAHYVERMFSRRGQLKSGTEQQILNWLKFLASQMQRHHQTVFLVEDLQPDWLPPRQQRLYRWNLRLVFGWLGGLVFGLVFGLSSGLLNGLIFLLSSGLICSLLGRPIFWWLDWLAAKRDGGKIRPAEVLGWSWKKVRMRLGSRRSLIYLLIILILSQVIRRLGGSFALEIAIQLSVVQVWLITGLVAGLSTDQLTDRTDFSPNEGIRRSGKHGLLIALIFWPIIVLLSLPFLGLLYGLIPGLVFSLQFGLLTALLIGLLAGGWYAFVRHFVLRMTLWSTKRLPWNVVSFLDEATTRLLLHKVGGGYIFIHRLLLDYFASLKTSSSEGESAVSAPLQKTSEKG